MLTTEAGIEALMRISKEFPNRMSATERVMRVNHVNSLENEKLKN